MLSSSVQPRAIDCSYILLCSAAGLLQAWCFTYGRDNLLVAIGMSLPFALASYTRALWLSKIRTVEARPNWKGILVLWAGMPLSLVVGALTILAETGVMVIAGFKIDDLPFYALRLLIGEAAACLAWAACLLVWSRQTGVCVSRKRLLASFSTLFAGVLAAYGLSGVILRSLHRNVYFPLTSVVATTISALILVFLRSKAQEAGTRSIAAVYM
jgi:hypothetical protein